MTVVAAANFFSELTLLSDSRVSIGEQPHRPDYGLIKTVAIINLEFGTAFVLAFSGELNVVEPILSFVVPRIENSKRRLVLEHLSQDMRRWIESVAVRLSDRRVSTANFLLGGLEALRRQPSIVPFHECHIHRYTITNKGKVSVSSPGSGTIIGSGSKLQPEIAVIMDQLLRFGRSSQHGEESRAVVLCYAVADRFREAQIPTVGGPYQVVVTRPGVVKPLYLWPDEQPNSDALMRESLNDGIKITNTANSRTCKLVDIWGWLRLFPEDFEVGAAAYC